MRTMNDEIISILNGANKLPPSTNTALPNHKNRETARLRAEGSITSVRKAMENIKHIIDAVTTDEKRIGFGEDYNHGKSVIPFICYKTIERKLGPATPFGKKKLDKPIQEVVDGKLTGDAFQLDIKFFECVIEFNIFANNTKEASEILEIFEDSLETYKGELKKSGIQDLKMLREVSPTTSSMHEYYPSKTILYSFSLQKITSTRLSTLKNVSVIVKENIQKANPKTDELCNFKFLEEMASANKLL